MTCSDNTLVLELDDLPDMIPEMHAEIAFTMLGAADAVIASLLSDRTDQVARVQARRRRRIRTGRQARPCD